ncbi:sensor histidine kinase, partial [Patescibacteria group bacterium]
ISLSEEDIFLEEILEKTIQSKQIEIKEKKLKVKVPSLKKKTLKMHVDSKKTQEVFDVVFDNAVRYNKKGGSIKVDIKKKKTRVVCSFEDTGIGISKNDLKIIYLKFMRGENANVCNTEGIGLSLYLAKIIVESSKGKIWCESKLNKGTKFYIELPLAK